MQVIVPPSACVLAVLVDALCAGILASVPEDIVWHTLQRAGMDRIDFESGAFLGQQGRFLRVEHHDSLMRFALRPAAFLEFVLYGVPRVFPPVLRGRFLGMPTAHSAPPLVSQVEPMGAPYVWPLADGTLQGVGLEPLHACVPGVTRELPQTYPYFTCIDAIRVGRPNERRLAATWLGYRLMRESTPRPV